MAYYRTRRRRTRGGRANHKTKKQQLPFSLTQCQSGHEVGTAGRSWPSTWTWASTAERRPNARHAGPFLLLSFIAIASSICVAFIVACRSRSTSAAGLLTRVQGAVPDRLCNNAPPSRTRAREMRSTCAMMSLTLCFPLITHQVPSTPAKHTVAAGTLMATTAMRSPTEIDGERRWEIEGER